MKKSIREKFYNQATAIIDESITFQKSGDMTLKELDVILEHMRVIKTLCSFNGAAANDGRTQPRTRTVHY